MAIQLHVDLEIKKDLTDEEVNHSIATALEIKPEDMNDNMEKP
jgi:hypothetical protein